MLKELSELSKFYFVLSAISSSMLKNKFSIEFEPRKRYIEIPNLTI